MLLLAGQGRQNSSLRHLVLEQTRTADGGRSCRALVALPRNSDGARLLAASPMFAIDTRCARRRRPQPPTRPTSLPPRYFRGAIRILSSSAAAAARSLLDVFGPKP